MTPRRVLTEKEMNDPNLLTKALEEHPAWQYALGLEADPGLEVMQPLMIPRNPDWERKSGLYRKAHPDCIVCGTRMGIEVHHEFPVHLFPDREMDEKYWHSLCRVHHYLVGHLCSWHSYNKDVVKDAAWWFNRIKTRPITR